MHANRLAFHRRGAALLLALGSLAGAALAQSAPAASGPAQAAPLHGPHGPRHGGDAMGPRHLERLLDRVNATPEQRTRIRTILDTARTEQRAQHEQGRSLRQQALGLFAQPSIDTAALEQLRQQQLAQHDQASKRWLQAMVDAANVLTPQQRAQLAQEMRNAPQGPGRWGR